MSGLAPEGMQDRVRVVPPGDVTRRDEPSAIGHPDGKVVSMPKGTPRCSRGHMDGGLRGKETTSPSGSPPVAIDLEHELDAKVISPVCRMLRCQILGGAIHGDFLVVRSFARSAQQNRYSEA
jgi:hypothetical protein